MPPATIANLTERRVPQYLAIYLGAAWGLVQFVDFLGTRYALSPEWTDMVMLAMGLLLPSVVLYTYFHGRPGRDHWQRAEKIFIPLNIVGVLSVLGLVGANTNLSAVTTRITVKDEKGNTITAAVPSKPYRKRVAMFALDPSGSTRWLAHGMPLLVYTHLQQQQFVEMVPSFYMRDRLGKAGFKDGTNVPLPLKRDVAREMHLPYFLSGSIADAEGSITATVQLYETANARLISEQRFVAAEPTALADQLSRNLLEKLNVPALGRTKPEMPVAELLTRNPGALRAYVDGTMAVELHDNWQGARKLIDEAVALDPTFAAAHIMRFGVELYSGRPQAALNAIQAAMDHSYRLPERTRNLIKANYYIAREDYPKAFAVCEMLAQLYPEDIQVQKQLLTIYKTRDDKEGVIATLQKILDLDPGRSELIPQLGWAYEAKGDYVHALEQYQLYVRRFPQEAGSFLKLGNLYRKIGEHAQARSAYDKALLIEPEDIDVLTAYAVLERNTGAFAAAEQHLQQALSAGKNPPERTRVLAGMAELYGFTGQIGRSLQAQRESMEEYGKSAPPAAVLLGTLMMAGEYAKIDPPRAERMLAEMAKQVTRPFDMYLPIVELNVALALDKPDRLDRAARSLDTAIERSSFKMWRAMAMHAHGRVSELRNDCANAITWYQQEKQLRPGEPAVQADLGRCYRTIGRTAEAERELLDAVRVMPALAPANLELALLYKQKGDAARAHLYAQRALRTWQNADAAYQVAARGKAQLAGI